MLPKRSSNASALVQSKSQVRRPLRYGATGVQSHPILVTVTACRLWPTSAPKRRPAIDPKRAFTTLFYSNSRNTTAVLSSGSPWMKESPVKTATRHSLFHAHITSLFLEWKSADISVLHLLWLRIRTRAQFTDPFPDQRFKIVCLLYSALLSMLTLSQRTGS